MKTIGIGAGVRKVHRLPSKGHLKNLTKEKILGRGPQDAMTSEVWETDIQELEKFISSDLSKK